MPITPRSGASFAAAATLLAGIVLNVVLGVGVDALPLPASSQPVPTPAGDASATPSASPSATPDLTPTPTPTPMPEPAARALSRTSGGTAARLTVTMHGRAMANVARVVVGDRDAQQLVLVSPTELRFVVPEAQDFAPGTVAIALVSRTDSAWIPTPFHWTYAVRSDVDREMAYALTHWSLHSSARFGYIPKNDCVNFVSQLLLARGWIQSGSWWNDGPVTRTVTVKKRVTVTAKRVITVPVPVAAAPSVTRKGAPTPTPSPVTTTAPKKVVKTVTKKVLKTVHKKVTTVDASAAWVSSTAMSAWLTSRPDLATRLTWAQRDRVRIGDVVQFDWTGAADSWDHTAVVSKIVVKGDGSEDIWYVEHTNHQLYGGSIESLMKQPAYAHMRVQFWRLAH